MGAETSKNTFEEVNNNQFESEDNQISKFKENDEQIEKQKNIELRK